jgi:hypothetical protein
MGNRVLTRAERRRRAGTISFSNSLLAACRLKVAAQHRHRAPSQTTAQLLSDSVASI